MTKRIRYLDRRHRWVLDWRALDTGSFMFGRSTSLYTFWRCRTCGKEAGQ